MVKTLVAILFATIIFSPSVSQVSNNQIKNRIRLSLDADWIASSTRNANVEWDCVNKALTNKCLIYHNDQWFTLTAPTSGIYYFNIVDQKCKNLRGVQIVILEGDPCKTETYQLRKCVPFTDQSDIFVRMDFLEEDKEYLVNIDGYLGDQCDFKVQFSSSLHGMPAQSHDLKAIDLSLTPVDSIISLQWTIPDSVYFQINKFLVYRKLESEKVSVLLETIPLMRNAYGASEKTFETSDTLHAHGKYTYSIFGATHDDLILLSKANTNYEPKPTYRYPSSYRTEIQYKSTRNGLVLVHVLDDTNAKYLFSTNRRVEEGKNTILLDLGDYVQKGIFFFKIIISNKGVREEHFVEFPQGAK